MVESLRRQKRVEPLNDSEFHILLDLADGERHGYGIMREVESRSQGTVRLGPGTLYGAIKRMLATGLIEESSKRPPVDKDDERRRCYYRLTSLAAKRQPGTASVWLWVMIDLCQTVPQQYLLSCLAGWRAKDMIPIRTTLLACLSIAAAFALNLVLFAVLNILLWAGWAAGLVTHYQHWPSTEVAVTLIPPFLTGLIAGWTKSFYRPYVSAPCSMILFGAALAFSDPRAPWLPALAYFLLVGAACEIGCYCAQKLAPRLQPPATAQQSLSG